MPDILRLWGKTAANDRFHPAVFHMLDVGHVATELLSERAATRLRRALMRVIATTSEQGVTWLPLVIALHDLGKISSPFQRQVDAQRLRLQTEGFVFETSPHMYRHQLITGADADAITRIVPQLEPLKRLLRDAWAGHHGAFATLSELKPVRDYLAVDEPPMWASLRANAIETLLAAFPFDNAPSLPPSNLRGATAALTGFLILCDWLGSDESAFPPEPDMTLDDYVPLSRKRARAAAERAGFVAADRPTRWRGFHSIFPGIVRPRPLQDAIDALPESAIAWPALFVIEAPTGEGKTEAALALARRMAAEGPSDEFYFALPTTATSNQMFVRVLRFLESITGERTSAQLVHGQAMLTRDALEERAYGDAQDIESPAFAVPNWFAPKKRALLAPFGVGTVDQAELAVLNARHYMLRLFGLAGKVVIVDEVHAYDTYMSTIIDHALWWFGVLGTSVILLSATLPQRRHREMAQSFQRGLAGMPLESGAVLPDPLPYPVLAAYPAHGDSVLLSPTRQPTGTTTHTPLRRAARAG